MNGFSILDLIRTLYRATLFKGKFNNALENWKPLFWLISVTILLKQLEYSLSIPIRR